MLTNQPKIIRNMISEHH